MDLFLKNKIKTLYKYGYLKINKLEKNYYRDAVAVVHFEFDQEAKKVPALRMLEIFFLKNRTHMFIQRH